jgi:carbonic anhydrase/acetyltransferase-like protein (isoleucine patch superfamily)
MIKSIKDILPIIQTNTFIAESADIIGDVTIGSNSSIWYQVVIRGDVNYIRIGSGTNIQDLSLLHVTGTKSTTRPGAPLIIGDNVTVGHKVTLHGCTIEDGAFIGMNAIIMDRVIVGTGAMIAAGSLVTEGTVVPPGTLWMGSPARFKRILTEEEKQRTIELAKSYVFLAGTYLAESLSIHRETDI